MKLNLGSGNVRIEGFTPIDRLYGREVYPLEYPDNSIDEIFASHVLEHFGYRETPLVLKEWVRVLKPGAPIAIAVPDYEKIETMPNTDCMKFGFLMGGQIDENDFHKSAWTREMLTDLMTDCGIVNIKPFACHLRGCCASMWISLNLQGVKGGQEA